MKQKITYMLFDEHSVSLEGLSQSAFLVSALYSAYNMLEIIESA